MAVHDRTRLIVSLHFFKTAPDGLKIGYLFDDRSFFEMKKHSAFFRIIYTLIIINHYLFYYSTANYEGFSAEYANAIEKNTGLKYNKSINRIQTKGDEILKVRLAVSEEDYEEIKSFLIEKGIEVDDDADFVLTQKDKYVGHIAVKNVKTGEKIHLAVDNIILIESYGHTVEVCDAENTYLTSDRLYQLVNVLDPGKFLRVSNSVIIAKKKVKQIRASLSMKFVLTMQNGRKVDVTRSYYNSFKDAFNI